MKNGMTFIAVFVLLNILVGSVSAEILVLAGSSTVEKRVLEPNIEAIREATGIQLGINTIGSNRGFQELIDGKVVASIASSSLASLLSEKGMEDNGVYQQHTIINDVISPVVHASNPVDELSWDQLAAIFSGEVTNWREVGGQDMPIEVVTGKPGSATQSIVQEKVMQGKKYTDSAVVVDITIYEIQYISKHPGAIGATSHALIQANSEKLKSVKTDEISRPLAFITKGNPTPGVQKVIDFLRTPEARNNYN